MSNSAGDLRKDPLRIQVQTASTFPFLKLVPRFSSLTPKWISSPPGRNSLAQFGRSGPRAPEPETSLRVRETDRGAFPPRAQFNNRPLCGRRCGLFSPGSRESSTSSERAASDRGCRDDHGSETEIATRGGCREWSGRRTFIHATAVVVYLSRSGDRRPAHDRHDPRASTLVPLPAFLDPAGPYPLLTHHITIITRLVALPLPTLAILIVHKTIIPVHRLDRSGRPNDRVGRDSDDKVVGSGRSRNDVDENGGEDGGEDVREA